MKRSRLIGALSAVLCCVTSLSSHAELVGVLPVTPNGTDWQAVNDTDLNITWIADANLAASNAFGVTGTNVNGVPVIQSSGAMTWFTAIEWIAGMNAANYLGFSDWRLPTTLVPDGSCDYSPADSQGYDCTGSEMGHLFYNEFNATSNPGLLSTEGLLSTGDVTELAKFTHIREHPYWSGTETSQFNDGDSAWTFSTYHGGQTPTVKTDSYLAWAVRGDSVSAVPVPAAVWLFGSGLLGLVGVARRKKTA